MFDPFGFKLGTLFLFIKNKELQVMKSVNCIPI